MANVDKIRDALKLLYGRLDSPLMRWKNARDEALAELDEIERTLASVEPEWEDALENTTTIDEVKQLVEDGEVTAVQAMGWEAANKRRSTLIEWLEGRFAE